jgi:hypothetical protein
VGTERRCDTKRHNATGTARAKPSRLGELLQSHRAGSTRVDPGTTYGPNPWLPTWPYDVTDQMGVGSARPPIFASTALSP